MSTSLISYVAVYVCVYVKLFKMRKVKMNGFGASENFRPGAS